MNAASLFEFRQGVLPSDFGLEYEPLTFQTKDNLTLRGYWIKADTPRGTIILIHGITDCKEHLYPLCQRLKEIRRDCAFQPF